MTDRLYRRHFILPVAFFDPAAGDWTASVHIEFTEKCKVHTVVVNSSVSFKTEALAKKFIIEEAKQWVDDRLRSACAIPSKHKRIS